MKVPRINVRYLLLAGIVLMIFDNIIDRISVILGRKAQEKIKTDVVRKDIEIEDISREVYANVDTNYLLVRYGVNEFLEQDPAPQDKRKMKIRNDEIPVETRYLSQSNTIEATIPFRIHRNFPTEFKFFLQVEDAGELKNIRDEFGASPSCESASISDSLEDRVYILLDEFKTTETPEGFKNNVVYPK